MSQNARRSSTAATAGVTHAEGLSGAVSTFLDRVRSGDLGSLPVVVGLVIIWTVFYVLNPIFLSPNNMVNLFFDCSVVGVISLGIVCVLLLGEIDLSVGSMSGVASALLGVLWVNQGLPVIVAAVAALAVGAGVGCDLCHAPHPALDAELRLDPLRPPGAPRAPALHAGLDRLDQPALRLWRRRLRPALRDAELALARAGADPGRRHALRRAPHHGAAPRRPALARFARRADRQARRS